MSVISAIGHVLMAIVGGITSVLVAIWNFIVRGAHCAIGLGADLVSCCLADLWLLLGWPSRKKYGLARAWLMNPVSARAGILGTVGQDKSAQKNHAVPLARGDHLLGRADSLRPTRSILRVSISRQ